ncbi:MAG TPA: Imm8 family immunity protein [Nocardioides sp.]|nr:Imm8 family immunity protein [Nocardioides sp.]
MRAALKSLDLEPDPATLPGNPAEFSLLARMIVGPGDGPGEESFDVTVCTPEWLGGVARGGFYDARHHVVVDFETFDRNALHRWLAKRVEAVQADSWAEIGGRLGRLGHWEFEDYRP